jgi:hypothetical protein
MDQINYQIDKLLQNKTVTFGLIIIMTIYAAHFAPKLSTQVLQYFNYSIVKIILISLIVYLSTKNLSIALVMTINFIVIMQTLRHSNDRKNIIKKIKENTEIVSDKKIDIINSILSGDIINKNEKLSLFDNIMKSMASDKHKFNSGMKLINSEPSAAKQVIEKLYEKIDNESNVINLTYNLCSDKNIKHKHMKQIAQKIIDSQIDDKAKMLVLVNVVGRNGISENTKDNILVKVKNSNLPDVFKSDIIGHIRGHNNNNVEHFEQNESKIFLTREDFNNDKNNVIYKIFDFLETNQ